MLRKVMFLLCLFAAGISVVKADDTYVKVTSTDQLVVGAEYILVAQTESDVCIASAFDTSWLSTITTGFVVDGHSITMTTGKPLLFVLGGTADRYTLEYSGGKYLGYGNYNSAQVNLKEYSSATEDNTGWTYDIEIGKISSILKSERFLGLSSNEDHKIKAMNQSVNPPANLYMRLSDVASITLSEACTDGTRYYGTYSSGNAFVVPDDLTVSEIKVDGDGKLTICNYEVGDIVPANTGVMVSSAAAGEHLVVLSDEEGKSILGDENCLYPSGDKGISAEEMGEAHPNCTYYRLTMHNGVTLGYYWGANGGGNFALAANKAYLAVPSATAARITGFDLGDHEVTGIGVLPVEVKDGTLYNLYGQRVSDSAKGIVIKNGKKQIKR